MIIIFINHVLNIYSMTKQLAARLIRYIFRSEFVKYVTCNRLLQEGLRLIVSELEYLQGIGAGVGVESSGEHVITNLLDDIDEKKNKLIFDVGANVGDYTDMVDRRVDRVNIHLFEPQQKLINQLEDKYSTDEKKRVNGFALSDENGQTTIHYDKQGSGLASMTKRRLDHFDINFDQKEQVETRILDKYCKDEGISEISLLKIDVEGHELEVLNGATDMISSGNIQYITFEFGGANIDTRTYFQDYYYFFNKHDYDIYRILPNSELYKIDSYSELNEKFRTTNYIAVCSTV